MKDNKNLNIKYLIENEVELSNSNDGGGSGLRATYDLILTPKNATSDETAKALSDIENYGKFKTQVLRNSSLSKREVNKALEDHFGPSVPSKKRSAEKARGSKFPIKTKQAIEDFLSSFNKKAEFFYWTVNDNDQLVFDKSKNPPKKYFDEVMDVVLGNAGIEYSITEKEKI